MDEMVEDSSSGVSSSSSGVASMRSSTNGSREIDAVVEAFLMEDVRRLGGEFLEVEVESSEAGWAAKQVWVVDGMGRLIRRVVTWGREGKRAETRLVYELDS